MRNADAWCTAFGSAKLVRFQVVTDEVNPDQR
jgi:hypothetical protein